MINSEQLRSALDRSTKAGTRIGQVLLEMKLVTEPQLVQALSVQQESLMGLLDVLAGEPLDECVSGTGVNSLFVLPVGSAKANHVGRLSPAAIRRLLMEAKKEFDVVLIDTGPVLGNLEASMLAPAADGVVLTISLTSNVLSPGDTMDHLFSISARVAVVCSIAPRL